MEGSGTVQFALLMGALCGMENTANNEFCLVEITETCNLVEPCDVPI